MNTHYTYFLILAASFAGPLALSFDKKVAFYKKWRYLIPAMILPAAIYIVWDSYFTSIGVWGFNPAYITNIYFFGLPLEEILFFLLIPYCCIFIYECIRSYFPGLKNILGADIFLQGLAIVLLIAGAVFHDRYYTFWTFTFNAFFIGLIYLLAGFFKTFDAAAFLVSYSICLAPFLIVNGFLTAMPVVVYNNAENLRLRIYSIPFEDIFYGMLLMLMVVVVYEKLLKREGRDNTN